MEKKLEKSTFGKRLGSMLRVDLRRMFKTPFFYIILGIAIVMPILILVMTSFMEGSPVTDSQTGEPVLDAEGNPVLMEGFDYAWQILGTVSSETNAGASADTAAGGMDMMAMCNINLLYFGVAVLVCIFISGDFKSGYSKNLFTVRAKKSDYVISKITVCTVSGMILILGFVVGTVIGGAVASLSFTMDGFSLFNLICCILSKLLLMGVFVSIYSVLAVVAKQKAWLSILLSCGVGMILFMMIPMLTPLDSTLINAGLCLGASVLLAIALGAISNLLLKKIDIL